MHNNDFFNTLSTYDKFFSAVCSNQIDVVKNLLPEITQINRYKQVKSTFYTVLHMACEKGYLEMVQLLVANGADINASSLEAPCNAFTDEQIIYAESELTNITDIVKSNPSIKTPLIIAGDNNHLEMVKFLLTAGANPNKQTHHGCALHGASAKANLELMEILIDGGAEIDKKIGYHSSTPLHLAVTKKDFDTVKFLLTKNAKTDIKDGQGEMAVDLVEKGSEIEKLFTIGPEYCRRNFCNIL